MAFLSNKNVLRRLKELFILLLGITIGAGGYYLYSSEELSTTVFSVNNKAKQKQDIKKYLNYLESSLDSLHRIKANPVPGDWLYDHEETGQTMEEYVNSNPVGKTGERYKVYIQMLGDANATEKAIMILTAEYLRCFYNVTVEMMEPMSADVIPVTQQRDHQGYHQLNARYILNEVLKPKLPDDAAAYMAFTNLDIYPSDDYNFVFGLGSLKNRVGVYSIARFGDPNFSQEAYKQCLSRTLKVASHELGHMFGVKHCVQYECVMNGSNHMEESDFKPQYLCPKDLFKVCWNLEMDEVYRFNNLMNFWQMIGFEENADFYRKSIALLNKEKSKKKIFEK